MIEIICILEIECYVPRVDLNMVVTGNCGDFNLFAGWGLKNTSKQERTLVRCTAVVHIINYVSKCRFLNSLSS